MRKRLYLASSIDVTAKSIAHAIGNVSTLKTVFITTAAEGETGDKNWLDDDRNGMIKAGFKLFDYTITGKSPRDIERDLKDIDIIHINGGNPFYLLLKARESGFDKWIKKAIKNGKIYIGSSAGSIIASPNIGITKILDIPIYQKKLRTFTSFGLVDFITLPHWGNTSFKNLYLNQRLSNAYKPENKIILLNDFQYMKVEDNLYHIVDIRDEDEKNNC